MGESKIRTAPEHINENRYKRYCSTGFLNKIKQWDDDLYSGPMHKNASLLGRSHCWLGIAVLSTISLTSKIKWMEICLHLKF